MKKRTSTSIFAVGDVSIADLAIPMSLLAQAVRPTWTPMSVGSGSGHALRAGRAEFQWPWPATSPRNPRHRIPRVPPRAAGALALVFVAPATQAAAAAWLNVCFGSKPTERLHCLKMTRRAITRLCTATQALAHLTNIPSSDRRSIVRPHQHSI